MPKTYLLVGAGSAIARATASSLTQRGARVVRASRQPEADGDLVFDASQPGTPPWTLPPQLDGLAYFPGTIRLRAFARLTAAEFAEDFQINCVGAVAAIQAALPALKAADAASIVLFSTVAVTQGMAFHASVAAAKGAVEGLARSLAAEFAPRIRVNVVAPSLTDTPLAGGLLGDEAKRSAAAARHPLRRVAGADEIGALVAFLLSDDARHLTGQVLRPDGGLTSVRVFT